MSTARSVPARVNSFLAVFIGFGNNVRYVAKKVNLRRACMRQYSPNEVARALGLNPRTVQREVNRGNLEAIRSPSGHFINVTEDALQKWLAGNQGKTVLARALQWKRRRKNRKQTAPTQGKPGPGEDEG